MRHPFRFFAFALASALVACADEEASSTSSFDTGSTGGASAAAGAPTGGSAGGVAMGGSSGGAKAASGGASAAGASSGGGAGGGGAGGGSGGATGGAAGSAGAASMVDPELLAACTTFWQSRCEEWSTCYSLDLATTFGDVATCVEAEAQHCARTTLGPASVATVSDVKACFDAYGKLDCPGVLRFLYENAPAPAACTFAPGKAAEGDPCVASSECATTLCVASDPSSDCGTCKKPLAKGGSCESDAECPGGMYCAPNGSGSSGACEPYLDGGAACKGYGCHVDLACISGKCGDRLVDGSVCDPQSDACGLSSACNGATNHCEPLATANVGEPCGEVTSGSFVICGLGARCNMEFAVNVGTCVAAAKIGDACTFQGQCDMFVDCVDGRCVPSELACGGGGAGGATGSGGSGGFDPGAPSDVYPAPHPPLPQAVKGAGSPLAAPVIVPIFFPGDTYETQLSTFVSNLVASTYFAATTSEYGVAQPTLAPKIDAPDMPAHIISDATIRAFLAAQLDGSHPEYMPATGDPVYTLFYPKGVTISDPLVGTSCSGFGGYHDTMVLPSGKAISYAVVPRCGTVNDVTTAATHELVETFTDPVVGFPAYAGIDSDHVIWGLFGGAELGDLCEFGQSNFVKDPAIGYLAQSTWSNASAKASHSPCVPWNGVFYAAAPVLPDDAYIGALGMTTKAVTIPVGGTRTIEVDLFSDGPTGGDFGVKAIDLGGMFGGTPQLKLVLDKSSGQNGEKLQLTITVLAADPQLGAEPFLLESALGSTTTQWWGLVAN